MTNGTKHKPETAALLGAAALFTALRLLLTRGLLIQFAPGSGYDDLLQIGKAFCVTNGQWLGEYGSLTLVKGAGYPLFAAALHALGIPYLFGCHLLYVIACGAFVWAVCPVVKNRLLRLFAYLFVLFNPIAFSADITRYYRDIIYYALALLAVALFLGVMLRRGGGAAAFLGGLALAFAALTREDSQWLYVYAVFSMAAAFLLAWKEKGFVSGAKRALPLFLAAAAGWCVLTGAVAAENQRRYGTFAVDEYNAGPYAQAYGALSRLNGGVEDSHIVIPEKERIKLYEASPAFAALQPVLDGENAAYGAWKAVQGEYLAGYFSLVLRDAIQSIGYYRTAAETNEYLNRLAGEVNAYCDDPANGAGPPRSTIVARIYPGQWAAVARQSLRGMAMTLAYTNVRWEPVPCAEDDKYLRVFEAYTGSAVAADRYMENGEIENNYAKAEGAALFARRGIRGLILLYRWAVPPLFALCVAVWVIQCLAAAKKRTLDSLLVWVGASSLLAAFLLRCAMLAYVDVTTFSTISNPAYQAASYAVMGAFAALQLALAGQYLAGEFIRRRASAKK